MRRDGEPVVGLSFQARGCGEFAQFGHEQLVRGPDLMLVDMGAPYSFGCAVGGGARVVLVSYDELDLPLDVVRAGVPGVAASPLRRLLRTHLARLVATAPATSADGGAPALGAATVELVRALVVSAAADDRLRAAVRDGTLVTRVRAYVSQRLGDPGLSPESIAAAHAVSVRQLYKAFSQAGLSLEQWVIGLRLEAARAELSRRRRTIAAVAHAHGFVDASHFSRRFKATYGMTPRDWQRTAPTD